MISALAFVEQWRLDHLREPMSPESLAQMMVAYAAQFVSEVRSDEQEHQAALFLDASGIGNMLAASIQEAIRADLRAQVEAMFAENLPPYLFRHNKDVLFPKMERTMLNDAIRDVWEQAKENVLALFGDAHEQK